MAEGNKAGIASSVFIQDLNNYNNVDGDSKNEALTMDVEGKIQYRDNDFNKDAAYSDKILNFRGEEGSDFYARTETKKGYVTTNGSFKYNGGNSNNVPVEQDDKVDSSNRLAGIFQVGDLNVNSLRSLHDESQKV